MQSLSMMLNTCPGLTTVVCFITYLEGFQAAKRRGMGTRLESLQGASS